LRFQKRYRTIGIIEVTVGTEIAIIAGDAITTFPSALCCVVNAITITITNQFRKRYRTIGIIESAVGAKIASIAVDAITTIPSALLGVVRLPITSTITNPVWIIYRTIGIASNVAVGAEVAIIAVDAITTFPSALFRVEHDLLATIFIAEHAPDITNAITNIFRKRHVTVGIMKGAVEAKISRLTAITAIPTTLLCVVRQAITPTITNEL
jgi:hypothetical protein